MDNRLAAAPAHVTIGDNHTHNTTETTAASTQVSIGATHTHTIVRIHTHTKMTKSKMVERKAMIM